MFPGDGVDDPLKGEVACAQMVDSSDPVKVARAEASLLASVEVRRVYEQRRLGRPLYLLWKDGFIRREGAIEIRARLTDVYPHERVLYCDERGVLRSVCMPPVAELTT